MISAETEATLRRLLTEQPTYRPVQRVLSQIANVTFICFVGAGGMGKTTLMDELVVFNGERYGKTRNFTSRPPRPDDDPKRYYYYQHTDEGLAPLLQRIERHENLQHNIDPYSGYVYGSEAGDYPHPYNLGDIWSTSIDGFRQLGFDKLYIFSVVTDADSWQRRFDMRFPADHDLREARLKEAAQSLTWSLAQKNSDHQWVINRDGDIRVAANSVDSIIRGEKSAGQNEARELAQQCLARAQELLG